MTSPTSDGFPRLLGDIGATNARFAMQLAPGKCLSEPRTLACADYSSLTQAIESYVRDCGAPRPRWGAIGIATPVSGDLVSMTNHPWSFSIRQLQQELGLERLQVLNDFTALALALPALTASDVRKIGGGKARPRSPMALLGPGSGLGTSGLIPCGDDYVPIQGEGGHVTIAAFDGRETAVIGKLRERQEHVSAERVLSGPGLVSLYLACASLQGAAAEALSASEISARAIAGTDPFCGDAIETFCRMLGTVASNLALVLGALGGVYIGGGIVPKLGDFFERSGFRTRFESKGRFSGYLAQIPTYVIHADYPGLLGAARALDRNSQRTEATSR